MYLCVLSCVCALFLIFNCSVFSTRNQITMTVHNVGNAFCLTVHDNSGNAALIGCGGDAYTVNSVANHLRMAGVLQPRLLLIPSEKITETANAEALLHTLQPEQTVATAAMLTDTKNITLAQQAEIQLWQNADLQFISTEKIRAAHLTLSGKSIVLCFYPSSDFSDADLVYCSGDILICRQAIPKSIDTSLFSEIIITSDKEEALYHFDTTLADKVCTTADEGRIQRIIR